MLRYLFFLIYVFIIKLGRLKDNMIKHKNSEGIITKKYRKKTSSKSYKVFTLLALSFVAVLFLIPEIMAHCPLCTGATIVGVGVTRSFGWDDSIIGIFVGAMVVSSALWANNVLKKKNIGGNAILRVTSITLATFVLTFLTFYYAGLFGLGNTYRIFGIEKIVFGTLSGSFVSLIAFTMSNKIKMKNKGKTLFNYQTMVLTFGGLILNALIFWLIF